ncbi:TPA: hypothetical protein NG505_000405 [Vibrio parahaemolyticus]|nr:hypothetical protein [Vibrio parahaemolyticus]
MSDFPDLIIAFDEAVEALKVKLSQDPNARIAYNGELIQSIAQDIKDEWSAISNMVQGRKSYKTKAAMDSDLTHPEDTLAQVWNDPVEENNGLYGKLGDAGLGNWQKSSYGDITNAVERVNKTAGVTGFGIVEYADAAQSTKDVTGSLIDGALVAGNTGVISANVNYERTDKIPVTPGMMVTYYGACKTQTGGAFYDENDVYLDGFWADNPDIGLYGLYINKFSMPAPVGAKYFIACNDKRESQTLKIMVATIGAEHIETTSGRSVDDGVKGVTSLEWFDLINLIDEGSVIDGEGINALNGFIAANASYERTDYIEIPFVPFKVKYKGYSRDQMGVATYDENKTFVDSPVYPSRDGLGVVTEMSFTITDERVKYIRACRHKDEENTQTLTLETTKVNHIYDLVRMLRDAMRLEKKDLVALYGKVDNSLVNASNGNFQSSSNYERSNYVPVSPPVEIHYEGFVRDMVGVCAYDENFQFVSALIYPAEELGDATTAITEKTMVIEDERIHYIVACAHKTEVTAKPLALKATSVRLQDEVRELQDDLSKVSLVDLVKNTTITTGRGINTSTGVEYSNENTYCTNFIPVIPGQSITYYGRTISLTGIAGYDASRGYVQAISPGEEVFERTYVIPEGVYYIRATSYSGYEAMALLSSMAPPEPRVNPPIRVVFSQANKFFVESRCHDGSYCRHEFLYVNRPTYGDDGWYSPWVHHNGRAIAQGNFNAIHIIDGTNHPNEDRYVGLMHGCETFKWVQFFIDGVEFDPTTATGVIEGDVFRWQFLSTINAADKAGSVAEGSEYTVPLMPLEPRTEHYMDCTIEGGNVIKRYNRLKMLDDNIQFKDLYMAMQQTNQPVIGGKLLLNDKDSLRNHFPNAPEIPEALYPSSIVMSGSKFGDGNQFASKVTAMTVEGGYDGYSYVMTTWQENLDKTQRHKNHVRAWCERTTSNKFYFQPVLTTTQGNADTFNTGDFIESESVTTIAVNKVSA